MNEIYAEILFTLADKIDLWKMPVVFILIGLVVAIGFYVFRGDNKG